MSGGPPLLSLDGIGKTYPGVVANADISLQVDRGEVVGILGENGAGKSTLMKILSGLVAPDSGTIRLDGAPMSFTGPRAAARAGIGMVHQHFALVGALTVEQNLALGDARWGRLPIGYAALREKLGRLAAALDMRLDFAARIDDLPVGRQQQVEILKVLAREPRLLILDEPTAVLAPDERAGLFRMIARLKARGVAIILISHKLEDVEQGCDRVVVMRQGRVVDQAAVAGRSRDDLVRLIVGDHLAPVEHRAATPGATVLAVENLTIRRPNGSVAVADASFTLQAGEIVGLCGVEGNGQTELLHVLAGMARADGGTLRYRLNAAEFGAADAATLRRHGLAHIAEDRLRHAVVAEASLADNWLLTNLHDRAFNTGVWLRRAPAVTRVAQAIGDYAIKAPGPRALLRQLSGGNQQKLVLARELAAGAGGAPPLVLAAHPTRGLDLRTIAFVQRELLRARDAGAAIVLLSADLAELWQMADRIAVMANGRLRGPVALSATTQQDVGHWMTAP